MGGRAWEGRGEEEERGGREERGGLSGNMAEEAFCLKSALRCRIYAVTSESSVILRL